MLKTNRIGAGRERAIPGDVVTGTFHDDYECDAGDPGPGVAFIGRVVSLYRDLIRVELDAPIAVRCYEPTTGRYPRVPLSMLDVSRLDVEIVQRCGLPLREHAGLFTVDERKARALAEVRP